MTFIPGHVSYLPPQPAAAEDEYLRKLLEGYAAYDGVLGDDSEELDEMRLLSVYSGACPTMPCRLFDGFVLRMTECGKMLGRACAAGQGLFVAPTWP
jgi:hypothetical protein